MLGFVMSAERRRRRVVARREESGGSRPEEGVRIGWRKRRDG